jgi:hypothetical protein
MSSPVISVIIVSDYAAGEEKSWDDFRQCLDGLARQDFAEPAEFLLCEWEGFRDAVPADLAPRLPSLQLVFESGRTAYELKNAGVRRAVAPIVAIVDADCVPMAGWLRAALEAFRAHPDAAAVSGRTVYRGRSRLERILALITRSLPTDGEAAETQRIAANNVAYSRQVYLRHPLSLEAGTWGSRLQNEAILRSGGKLYFEPRMQVAHDHTGWSMEWDIRRSIGRSLVTTRQVDPLQPYAWALRLGYAAVPIFVLGQTLLTARRCWLWHRYYGVRLYELPAALVLALMTHMMEVPGIVQALRGQPVGTTQFR